MLTEKLPIITAFALSVAIGAALFIQIRDFNFGESITTSPILTPKSSQSIQPKQKSLRDISALKLFGDKQKVVTPKPVQPVELPKTRLKLTLMGVMAGKSPLQGGAIIQGPSRNAEFYQINSELPGGATLKQVYADRVVVQRGIKLENLFFPEIANIGFSTDDQPVLASRQTTPVRSSPQSTASSSKTQANNTPDNRPKPLSSASKQSIKERLKKLRQRSMQK